MSLYPSLRLFSFFLSLDLLPLTLSFRFSSPQSLRNSLQYSVSFSNPAMPKWATSKPSVFGTPQLFFILLCGNQPVISESVLGICKLALI